MDPRYLRLNNSVQMRSSLSTQHQGGVTDQACRIPALDKELIADPRLRKRKRRGNGKEDNFSAKRHCCDKSQRMTSDHDSHSACGCEVIVIEDDGSLQTLTSTAKEPAETTSKYSQTTSTSSSSSLSNDVIIIEDDLVPQETVKTISTQTKISRKVHSKASDLHNEDVIVYGYDPGPISSVKDQPITSSRIQNVIVIDNDDDQEITCRGTLTSVKGPGSTSSVKGHLSTSSSTKSADVIIIDDDLETRLGIKDSRTPTSCVRDPSATSSGHNHDVIIIEDDDDDPIIHNYNPVATSSVNSQELVAKKPQNGSTVINNDIVQDPQLSQSSRKRRRTGEDSEEGNSDAKRQCRDSQLTSSVQNSQALTNPRSRSGVIDSHTPSNVHAIRRPEPWARSRVHCDGGDGLLPTLNSSVKDPCMQMTSSLKDPYMQVASSVKDPLMQMVSSVKDPHMQMSSSVKDPHMPMSSSVKDPHMQMSSSVKDPHMQMVSSVKDPHMQMTFNVNELQTTSSVKTLQTVSRTSLRDPQMTTNNEVLRHLQTSPSSVLEGHRVLGELRSATIAQNHPTPTGCWSESRNRDPQENIMNYNDAKNQHCSKCCTESDEVAIDCEMADVRIGLDGMTKRVMISVAIVDSSMKLVYYGVCPPPGWNTATCRSELVVPRTRRFPPFIVQQFQEAVLKGVTFKSVRAQVAAIIHNKKVIGHSLDCDLKLLELRIPRQKAYDTHYHYRPLRCHELGLGIMPWTNKGQGFSLKFITMLILGQTIQNGPHDASEDSAATMRLYLYDKHNFKSISELGLTTGLRDGRLVSFGTCYY